MGRPAIIISLSLILLAAAGYFTYDIYFNKRAIDVWDIVPGNALIVYEQSECQSCMDEIKQSAVWKIIENASFYNEKNDSLTASLAKVVSSNPQLMISVHATNKDDFDYVFYLPDFKDQPDLVNKTFGSKAFRQRKREFNSVSIHEASFSRQVFSWTVIDHIWVGSFTSFLIEDVVRASSGKNGFKDKISSVHRLSQENSNAGNIYLQLSNFTDWLSLFYSHDNSLPEVLGRSTSLTVKPEPGHIVLNGVSTDTADQSKYLLSVFHRQSPVSFNLKDLIANSTIALKSFGVSDGASFRSDLRTFVTGNAPGVIDSLDLLGKTAHVDFSELYNSIQDEVGLCHIESFKRQKMSRVLIIETAKATTWLSAFHKLAESFSIDTIFYEKFGDHELREIPVHRFPEKLFWPLVKGFDQSFYTSLNNTILIADNLEDLKRFLTLIEEDETWGKSVSQNRFLERTLLESNLSLYLNTPKVWNLVSAQLQPRWRQFIRDNEDLLRSLDMSAFQFSNLSNAYYTNISIGHKPAAARKANEKRDRFITNFENGIRKLYTVKSHVDRSDEILVQDSVNDLSLVSDEGSVLWKIPVGDRITSDVTQIDFYANGKLQYFFTTRTGLHVIDRSGNYVDPFPVLLSSIEFEHGVVIDYDHSKKYRFLVADRNGRLWMYDKEVSNLEGWRPKETGGALATPPRHHRIKGKDYLVAIRSDGKVQLMNRKGENIRNFPLDLEGRVTGDYFLETGNSSSETYFVVVTDDGYKIRFTTDGKILSRETLLKTSVNTRYKLIAERNFKSYLVIQQDARYFNIMDETGKRIISNDAVAGNQVVVDYYDFGTGRDYISVTDLSQGFTYLYDGSGALLTEPPLETTLVELRPKDADENRLFYVEGRSLTISSMKR